MIERPSTEALIAVTQPPAAGDDVALADLTREELIALVESHQEHGIRISFSGKDNARGLSRRVRPRVTREIKRYGAGEEGQRAVNLLLEGDNLQAMATLYKLRGQVDMIITDPPYNTGNDWRYNDKWENDPNDPGIGEFVSADGGARHTKWMRFMYPRLQMMKSMLRPGGVLAICIDHRELFRLGQLLDELFKQENRIAVINWEKSYSPRSDKTHVSAATEYVLVYAKDESRARTGLLPRTDVMDARYRSPDGDPRLWKGADASGGKGVGNQSMIYAIQSPFTGELFYPPDGNCWRTAQRTLLKWLQEWGVAYQLKQLDDDARRAAVVGVNPADMATAKGIVVKGSLAAARKAAQSSLDAGFWPQVFFGQDGQGRPQLKRYLEDVKRGKVVTTWWADDDYDEPLALGSVSWAHEQSGHTQTGVDDVVDGVTAKLGAEAPGIQLIVTPPERPKPAALPVRIERSINTTDLDTRHAVEPVRKLITHLTDYRHDDGTNIHAKGGRVFVQRNVGDQTEPDFEWEEFEHTNLVSVRWLFQREIRRRYPGALGVAETDTAKFDALVGFGSNAYEQVLRTADDVVTAYTGNILLVQPRPNPYRVGPVLVRPDDLKTFTNSLHEGYSDMNPEELACAREIDATGHSWCRNPSRSGYGIPLITIGRTRTFYPDFLVWTGEEGDSDVFAVDTTGAHLLGDKTGRKMLAVRPPRGSDKELIVRFISRGRQDAQLTNLDDQGYTVWGRRAADASLRLHHTTDLHEAVDRALRPM